MQRAGDDNEDVESCDCQTCVPSEARAGCFGWMREVGRRIRRLFNLNRHPLQTPVKVTQVYSDYFKIILGYNVTKSGSKNNKQIKTIQFNCYYMIILT